MQLPPKRYSDDKNTAYDGIRHNGWFTSLETRREKLPMLRQARLLMSNDGLQRKEACAIIGVEEKELGDYNDFMDGRSRLSELEDRTRKIYQAILDGAYDSYKYLGASVAFTKIIYKQSTFFGVDARIVVELWDCDPTFYPTNYKGVR